MLERHNGVAGSAVPSSSSTSWTPWARFAPAERPRVTVDRARAAVSSVRIFPLRQDQGQVSTAAWRSGSADDGQGSTPAGCPPGKVEFPHAVSLSGAHIELLCPMNTADRRACGKAAITAEMMIRKAPQFLGAARDL